MYAVEPINYLGNKPTKTHEDDAAFDLHAHHAAYIPRGEHRLIRCGLSLEIPTGFVGLVCSRSGLAANLGVFVLNAPGVIDPGFRGDVSVILANFSLVPHHVTAGDRIAQLLILPNSNFRMVERINLSTTDRGEDGFGSTGIGHAA